MNGFAQSMLLAQEGAGAAGAVGAIFFIVYLAIIVLIIAGFWKTFAKAGKPGGARSFPSTT